MHLDKSLPSLPPQEHQVPTPSSDPYSDASNEMPSRPRIDEDRGASKQDPWSQAQQGNHMLLGFDMTSSNPPRIDNLILPASTYNGKRHSVSSHKSDGSAGEEFLIPVAFDPTPSEHTSPRINTLDSSKAVEDRSHDYFNRNAASESPMKSTYDSQRPPTAERPSASPEHQLQNVTYQEQRPADTDLRSRRQDGSTDSVGSATSSSRPRTKQGQQSSDLQKEEDSFTNDAQKNKKPTSPSLPGSRNESREQSISLQTPTKDSDNAASKGRDRKSSEHSRQTTSASPAQMQYPPKRGDSLESKLHHTLAKKNADNVRTSQIQGYPKTDKVTTSAPETGKTEGRMTGKLDSRRPFDESTPVASPRPHTSGSTPLKDQAVTPQPMDRRFTLDRNESSNSVQSESRRVESSLSLPRYSSGGDFSFEEDMARILGEDSQNHDSFLRRVSNSVRHGRSFSEKGSRLSKELKWPKSPSSGSVFQQDLSSPNATSSETRDELSWIKNELGRERQKIIEKDQKIAELEAAVNATASIKEVNTELREKRSTMVFLDAQKEIVLRELEVLREHIATEKQSSAPLDLGKMSNSVVRDFAEALQRLKEAFMPQIEELIQKRNDLMEELGSLGRMKDKSFQEFEQLSLKNAQLAELNNQLVHQIQELYKANSNITDNSRQGPNGLGIYHQKDKSITSVERELRSAGNEQVSGMGQAEEAEPVTVIQGPQVVNIRKGQPKKFNWKKGGQNVAKGVTKGLKGAFLYGEGKTQRDGQFTETAPYGSIPLTGETNAGAIRTQTQDPSRQGFGFFGNQKNKASAWKGQANGGPSGSLDAPVGELMLYCYGHCQL